MKKMGKVLASGILLLFDVEMTLLATPLRVKYMIITMLIFRRTMVGRWGEDVRKCHSLVRPVKSLSKTGL